MLCVKKKTRKREKEMRGQQVRDGGEDEETASVPCEKRRIYDSRKKRKYAGSGEPRRRYE